MTSEEDSRSRQAQYGDAGSVRSDAAECDDEDEDDIGIVFTVPAKVPVHDSKWVVPVVLALMHQPTKFQYKRAMND